MRVEDAVVEIVVDVLNVDCLDAQSPLTPLVGEIGDAGHEAFVRDEEIIRTAAVVSQVGGRVFNDCLRLMELIASQGNILD